MTTPTRCVRHRNLLATLVLSAGWVTGVLLTATNAAAQTSPPSGSAAPVVRQIDITGPVDPLVARMAKRGIAEAKDEAAAVLIRLDTPGGLDSSMRSIIKSIQASSVPVVCWVGPPGARAASAGTFILLACPVAVMAPGTNVGAAHPVGLTGDVLAEKVTNDAAAYIRSLAEQRGRNADWAEDAVRSSVSISAEEALRIDVIDFIERDVPAVLARVDGTRVDTANGPTVIHVKDASIERVELTWAERLLHGLFDPNLAFLFFTLGVAGLVLELLHPGISVPGVTGLILLVTSLVIFGTLPVNVGGLLLLAAAFVFFVIDLQVAGHGLPTAAGLVCLLLGGLFLFDSSVPNARVSRPLLGAIALTMAALFFFVVRAAIKVRRMTVSSGTSALVGAEGVVEDECAPTGRVRVQGESWRAVVGPEPAVIPPGTRVRVLGVRGLTLDVEPCDPSDATTNSQGDKDDRMVDHRGDRAPDRDRDPGPSRQDRS